jgi:RNA polymerase sigma-70 factor (ECF subfamily)
MTAAALTNQKMQTLDSELAMRCRNGDKKAFGQIYARYEGAIFRYAFYLTGNREDAADIKQETFLRAYHAIATFRAEASLQTWLLKICVNLCRDRVRSWSHRQIVYRETPENLVGIAEADNPQQALEHAHLIQTILRALKGLSPAQREIVALHTIEEFDYPEIGRILGCTATTAKMRVFRARKCLKDRVFSLLKGDDYDEN